MVGAGGLLPVLFPAARVTGPPGPWLSQSRDLPTTVHGSQAGISLYAGGWGLFPGPPCSLVGPGSVPVPHEYFVSFLGFPLFLLSEPWTMGFSKSFKRKFFYNKKTKISTFDLPADSIAPFQ